MAFNSIRRPGTSGEGKAGGGAGGGLLKALGLAGLLLAVSSLPGEAQQAGAGIWSRGGCADCHGNLAAGDGDPTYPPGPNLRRITLKRDELIETIACGRPGTGMPTNMKGAWTATSCFGIPPGAVPMDVVARATLTAQEVDTLADFLLNFVVGKTKITRENCAIFNEGNANTPACLQY